MAGAAVLVQLAHAHALRSTVLLPLLHVPAGAGTVPEAGVGADVAENACCLCVTASLARRAASHAAATMYQVKCVLSDMCGCSMR